MKKIILVFTSLVVASLAHAQNVPSGLTGLWRFQSALPTGDATMAATVGVDMINSNPPNNGHWYTGPWTELGIVGSPTLYSDNGVAQERSWDYLTVNPSFTANGGGSYVNEYTVAIDYEQTSGLDKWNSLFQTADTGNASDGDLFTDGAGHIGIGAVGYSTMTYDASTWHRIVWSIDNGNFFRVYVDGTLFLDGAGQAVDGRFSLYPDHFHLFADDSWEDQWGLVGTVATWDRALTSEEVAGMGGWLDGSATPTPLLMVVPEPTTFSLAVLGGLIFLFKRSRR